MLAPEASTVASQVAVRPYHAVAGNHDGDPVVPVCTAHRTLAAGVAFHPLSDALVTAAPLERKIGIRNAREPENKVKDITGACGAPQFSAEGDLLLAGTSLYDPQEWKLLATAPLKIPTTLAPDGSRVAGVQSTDDKTIRILPVKR